MRTPYWSLQKLAGARTEGSLLTIASAAATPCAAAASQCSLRTCSPSAGSHGRAASPAADTSGRAPRPDESTATAPRSSPLPPSRARGGAGIEDQDVVRRVEPRGGFPEQEFDGVVGVPIGVAERERAIGTSQQLLRQRRAVVGEVRLCADHADRGVVAATPQPLGAA